MAASAAVIGHEISHGFDDQKQAYDAEGVLRNWWPRPTGGISTSAPRPSSTVRDLQPDPD